LQTTAGPAVQTDFPVVVFSWQVSLVQPDASAAQASPFAAFEYWQPRAGWQVKLWHCESVSPAPQLRTSLFVALQTLFVPPVQVAVSVGPEPVQTSPSSQIVPAARFPFVQGSFAPKTNVKTSAGAPDVDVNVAVQFIVWKRAGPVVNVSAEASVGTFG
jgi:hypothetical protein